MKLFVNKLTEEYAKQLCTWKYEGEYSVYDFAPWDIAMQQNWSITNPEVRESDFRSVISEQGNLIGFFRMTGDEQGNIEIGLGLKPQHCGQGLGKKFVKLITQYTLVHYPNQLTYMEVRTFNVRAVKCYKSLGYTIVLQHHKDLPWGSNEYFLMQYPKTIIEPFTNC